MTQRQFSLEQLPRQCCARLANMQTRSSDIYIVTWYHNSKHRLFVQEIGLLQSATAKHTLSGPETLLLGNYTHSTGSLCRSHACFRVRLRCAYACGRLYWGHYALKCSSWAIPQCRTSLQVVCLLHSAPVVHLLGKPETC